MTDWHEQSGLPDKRRVAESFSRAADSYDSVAALQRDVGIELLARLPLSLAPRRWLDLGCGTGHFSRVLAARYPAAEGVALDLAEGMLRHARPLGGAQHFVAGDAERLPLREAGCDLIFSSLAVQWCGDFAAVLAEARRALRPGGVLAFSSLCVGTLQELRDSWQAVDGFVHVNRFRRFADYQQLCAASGLQPLALERRAKVLHFPDLRALTHELKALGAHNLNPGRPGGLTGRARIRALVEAYERFRQPQGLPATYQVVYGVLQRPE
ncbi:malonyl-ACP O-methyltransferase BioC [Pseudomonas alcaligenes]|uniref:malonyl-ACP O-methyltransferase BioC n=1 Tax=Aquipseudomonas alcaligenes TaxID=43263 RepID=UPI00358E34BC